MFLAKELFFASFRSVPFLMDSHSMSDGRKTVTHEYPNKKYVFVEDLGQKLRTFKIDAVVTGKDYYIRRDALIIALNLPGIGVLTHPFLGVLNVTVIEYTLDEAPRSLGEAKFSITFQESNISIFPIVSPFSSDIINTIVNNLESYFAASLITIFTTQFNNNITHNADKCNTLATNTSNNIQISKNINQNNLNVFNDLNKSFIVNQYMLVQNPELLASNIYSLLQAYNDLSIDATEQYNLNSVIYYFGSDDNILNLETASLIERRNDFLAINSQVNAIALSNMYLAAALINYLDNIQLDNISNDLESKYQYLMVNNNLDGGTLTQLETLRVRMIQFFNNTSINISKVVNVSINYSIPLTILMYGYYEDFTNENEIIALNNILDTSVITGNLKLLSSEEQ